MRESTGSHTNSTRPTPRRISDSSISDSKMASSGSTELLQIGPDDREGPAVPRVELGSDAKERMNESALPDHIALRQPSDLPFSDQMHCLITIDGPQCPFC